MSDFEKPPVPDADRTATDGEDDLDLEAPTDSELVNPPQEDAERTVPELEDLPEENAATSLDQPSDQSS